MPSLEFDVTLQMILLHPLGLAYDVGHTRRKGSPGRPRESVDNEHIILQFPWTFTLGGFGWRDLLAYIL